jgi:hypothetical protein
MMDLLPETLLIVFFGCLLIAAPFALIFFGIRQREKGKQRRREIIADAGKKYQASLNDLRQNPSDSRYREAALVTGREFARLAREGGQETLFDEVALMNDINAIAGGSVAISAQPAIHTPVVRPSKIESHGSHEDRLRTLNELKTKGLITDAEYQERRSKILDEI